VPFGEDAVERFHRLHERRYGFANRERGFEIVNVRVRVRVPAEAYVPVRSEVRAGDGAVAFVEERQVWFEGGWRATRVYEREMLRAGDVVHGPALVTEYTSATVLLPGCVCEVDGLGNLVVEVGEAGSRRE
jgi:N-methylhydantoinase A